MTQQTNGSMPWKVAVALLMAIISILAFLSTSYASTDRVDALENSMKASDARTEKWRYRIEDKIDKLLSGRRDA